MTDELRTTLLWATGELIRLQDDIVKIGNIIRCAIIEDDINSRDEMEKKNG